LPNSGIVRLTPKEEAARRRIALRMTVTVTAGQIWITRFPFKDNPSQGKERRVVVVAVSPQGPNEDAVVLLVPITGHHGGGLQRNGEIAVLNYRNIPGLSDGDGAWIQARRLWGADPAVLDFKTGPIGVLPQDLMSAVYDEIINGLFGG
jgi:PemK-like, MazF-like toxin of type II toxin-antitoxin system